jgi:hypothetical protein
LGRAIAAWPKLFLLIGQSKSALNQRKDLGFKIAIQNQELSLVNSRKIFVFWIRNLPFEKKEEIVLLKN